MSDEPTPPSLRLKPRQAPMPDAPAPVASPQEPALEPVSEAAAPLNDPFRLRIKPKAPPPEGSPSDTSGVTFSTPVPFSAPPMPTASANLAPAETSSALVAANQLPSVPLPPVSPSYVSPPKPQYVPTPPGMADPAYATATKTSPPTIKADKWLAGLVLLALLVAVGIYSVRQLTKPHPKVQAPVAVATPPAAPVVPAAAQPTPVKPASKLVDKPVSAAGKAIAKARDLVAAHDKQVKEQGVDSVLEEPTATTVTKTPTSSTVAPPSSVTLVTESVATPAQPEPPPPASDAFRQFVVNMRVNGVFQGENARAMLNGKMYHPGDVVDVKLGVSLLKIEVEAKQIVFRDADGAIVSRHY